MRLMRHLIGLAMRTYRASPLHPRLGRALARVLALVPVGKSALVLHEVDGLRFELDLREVIDASLYYSGTFEPHAERVVSRSLHPGMFALDVGANIGYHTLRMARSVGANGRVIAVEPSSRALTRLRRNIELNSLANVLVLPVALDQEERGAVAASFRSSYRLDGSRDDPVERVRLRTVDGVVDELALERLDFIKLDVDGWESKVLRGASKTLARFLPTILCEMAPSLAPAGERLDDVLDRLVALGYRFETEDGRPVADVVRLCGGIASGFSANLLASPPRPPGGHDGPLARPRSSCSG